MVDEFINVRNGEEFEFNDKRYRKVDDRRAVLVCTETGDSNGTYNFYPEDKIRRKCLIHCSQNDCGPVASEKLL
ncbi:hypothetical protein [Novipirellula rosea]|uniref:Uncharacterized protein n=1 Tax=Novipirellula rosea TaxID=1031540 RepID=A0ABP8N009_9BACT